MSEWVCRYCGDHKVEKFGQSCGGCQNKLNNSRSRPRLQIVTGGWRDRLKAKGDTGAIEHADMGIFDEIGKDPETGKQFAETNYDPYR